MTRTANWTPPPREAFAYAPESDRRILKFRIDSAKALDRSIKSFQRQRYKGRAGRLMQHHEDDILRAMRIAWNRLHPDEKYHYPPYIAPNYPPPPAVPKIRMSIRKDGDNWIVTTIKQVWTVEKTPFADSREGDQPHLVRRTVKEYRETYTASPEYSDEAMTEICYPAHLALERLLDELIDEHVPRCHWCGVPLVKTAANGFICCPRHLEHYPQPESVTSKCERLGANITGFSADEWHGRSLPVIPSARIPALPTNHSRIMAWCAKHVISEVTDGKSPDGVREIKGRMTWRMPPAKSLSEYEQRLAEWHRQHPGCLPAPSEPVAEVVRLPQAKQAAAATPAATPLPSPIPESRPPSTAADLFRHGWSASAIVKRLALTLQDVYHQLYQAGLRVSP